MGLRTDNSKGKARRAEGATRDETRRRSIGSRRSLVLLASLTVLLAVSISLAAAGAFAPLLRPAPRAPEPPTPPAPTITSRPADPTTQATAHFTYSDAQSGVDLQCQLDGGSFGSCPTGGVNYPGPLAQGQHTFKVRAVGGSKTSSTASYSWTIDTTAPSASISYPGDGLTLGAADWGAHCPGHASLCGSASDAHGVKAVLLSIQRVGGNWWGGGAFDRSSEMFGPVDVSGGGHDTVRWSYSLSLPADGTYTLHVRATDEAGNATQTSAQASSRFTIDTAAPPTPSITGKPAATTTAKSATFTFADGEQAARFLCRRDGSRFSACSSPQPYSSLPLGSHRFEVEAVDAVGNTSAPAGYTWTIVKEIAKEAEGKPFTVSGSASGPLSPGVTRALVITLSNPNNVTITVTALTATVAASSSKAGCDGPSNLQLTQSNISEANALTIPANGQVALPSGAISAPQVLMKDLPINQDACKGASFTFTYSGSAHS
jgi:Bacterial Ig-like domain